ncbi:hypothetical protein BDV98DRAFT_606797 [Pterulicium gracile]|uniref:Uncharacterized protein n=1 Tax=Pterulicium gracile TaxID=1884261 RepID=A0A5C3QEA0_9AGAR|nr:hypothetical protein BDV98DRAFT_606797 [Pterula gracilis]
MDADVDHIADETEVQGSHHEPDPAANAEPLSQEKTGFAQSVKTIKASLASAIPGITFSFVTSRLPRCSGVRDSGAQQHKVHAASEQIRKYAMISETICDIMEPSSYRFSRHQKLDQKLVEDDYEALEEDLLEVLGELTTDPEVVLKFLPEQYEALQATQQADVSIGQEYGQKQVLVNPSLNEEIGMNWDSPWRRKMISFVGTMATQAFQED